MKTGKITISAAVIYALRELDIKQSGCEWFFEGKSENYYEFTILASYMKYTVFVDDITGYVAGIDSEPRSGLDLAYTSDNYYQKIA